MSETYKCYVLLSEENTPTKLGKRSLARAVATETGVSLETCLACELKPLANKEDLAVVEVAGDLGNVFEIASYEIADKAELVYKIENGYFDGLILRGNIGLGQHAFAVFRPKRWFEAVQTRGLTLYVVPIGDLYVPDEPAST